MLLTAINYQNNLIYLLTFVLGGMFLVSIWLCFFNLSGMTIRYKGDGPVEAGQVVSFELHADLAGKQRASVYVSTEGRNHCEWLPVQSDTCKIAGQVYSRGIYDLPAFKIETYFPFGLVRAWSWMWFDTRLVVYPKPIEPPFVTDNVDSPSPESHAHMHFSDDLDALKRYSAGDNLRRVLWRHYVRHDDLMVRAPDIVASATMDLHWVSYSAYGKELALSYLAHDVLSLAQSGTGFALYLPGCVIEHGDGDGHRDLCLRALAEME